MTPTNTDTEKGRGMGEVPELFPCPFCATTPYACEYNGGKVRFAHRGNDCILSRRFIYPNEFRRWNRRAHPTPSDTQEQG